MANTGRIQAVDALRGIAAISVAWYHFTTIAGALADGWLKAISAYGWLGVEVFFVISGFILPHALHEGHYKLRDYPRFIARRLVRLEPPYLASLAVAIGLGYATNLVPGFGGRPFETSASSVLLHVGYLAPLFGVDWIVPAYWSLAIECQYYLLIGLLFPAISHPRAVVRLAGFAILSALVLAVPSQLCVSHWLPLFALGIIVYQFRVALLPPRLLAPALTLTACVVWLKLGILVALVGTASAIAIACLQMQSPLARSLGEVSYSLYLLHVPLGERVVLAGQRTAPVGTPGIAVSVAALLVSIAGAYLLNRLVERPAQRAASGLRYAGSLRKHGLDVRPEERAAACSQFGCASRRILYVQYAPSGGFPPLLHSARLLVRNGWEARFLAVGAYGTEKLRLQADGGIAITELRYCPPGWRQKLHYVTFCLRAIALACVWRPAWLYASDVLASPVALLLSYLPSLHVIYHEHDSPNGDERSLALRACLWARRRLARRAKICLLPNERRAEVFTQTTGSHCTAVVWNCPLRADVLPAQTAPGDGGLFLYFHGSLNPIRLPAAVLAAIAEAPPDVRLRVVGYETIGHAGYVTRLQELARELAISDRIDFLGTVPREQLFVLASECHVGLAFMPTATEDVNHKYMAGASNKPFEYLACGLALLVPDLPDWRECYVEPGYARACDPENPASIAEALRWFLQHRDETRAMGQRGRERILADWNYEEQFAPVMRRMNAEAGA